MANGSGSSALTHLFAMPRFAPALFATFMFGLLLLFVKELDQVVRSFLLPSLLIYAQGAALLGTLHRLLGIHYFDGSTQNNEQPIPKKWKWTLLLLHVIWFVAFIGYNYYRGVL